MVDGDRPIRAAISRIVRPSRRRSARRTRSFSDRYRGEYRLTARATGVITGGKSSTRPPDLIVRPLRHRLPVRGLIPTMRDARS